ncbi:hypothetical protein [[Flexibacter] sp. ATCC 35208]|nr:hypothetical protein [[Flexibacter] sp. ATCC 35208]OMP78203.1 hypothetical protein BW716_15620 [[Flexibacter] sp. ATCC 35208]
MTNPENSTPTTTKPTPTPYDYHYLLQYVSSIGKDMYGRDYTIADIDKPIISRLLCYFLKDREVAAAEKIDLQKGILLMGPVGCGKSSIMKIMNNFCPAPDKPVFHSCNEIAIDFNTKGYETILKYTKGSFFPYTSIPRVHCFDDLGLEPPGYYYGNNSNVMAEILLSRYNYFTSCDMITHITTNLNTSELEAIYGNRIRSRMREMFNQIIFSNTSPDKRK